MKSIRLPKAQALPPPPLESVEQASFVAWWRNYQFPRVLIYAVPNGTFLFGDAERRAKQMHRLKLQGLVPGIPNLHVPEWRLYIEFKRAKGGRLSPDQIAIHALLRAAGYTVLVCAGAEAARLAVLAFVRERAA